MQPESIACRLIGKRDFAHFLIFKMSANGAKVQRRTFDKWAVSGVLGHKTVIESGLLEYVYFFWCKVCAANKGKTLKHPAVKGATKVAADTYINGTNVVTKYSVGNKKNYRKEITSTDLFLYLHVF